MADQKILKKRLKVLMGLPENQVCSDCTERQPRWASLIVPPPGAPEGSLPIGAFCCLECSGSHRRLGVHISFVRSINLDSWKEREVLAMENGGNAKVNHIFEAHLNRDKPTNHADLQTRERYIRDKYERRKFYDPAAFNSYAASTRNRAPPPPQQQHQPQEIALPALLPTPAGPPSDVAQRRIEERRRRNQATSPKEKTSSSRSRSGEKPKKGSSSNSRKIKSQGSGTLSASSSIDLLDFGSDPAPAPAPSSQAADLFGFAPTDTQAAAPTNHYDAFGSEFFKAEQPSPAPAPSKSNNAADIMALYGGSSGGNTNQSNGNAFGGQSGFGNSGHTNNSNGAMNAMANQMGRMDLNNNFGNTNPQMWTPQQQQQMMMMQQQQQMMMMMQQQQQQHGGGNAFGMANPGMMNGGMMATAAAQNNGFGGQGTGGRKKEDPFAALGGRNTFR